MKDKEWAKCIVRKELKSWQNIEGGIDEDGIKYVLNIIDQLDEPEVLSQELPVIPKYVAEYIDLVKIDIPLMKILEVANRRNELPEWKKEYDWISANDETFARAWLDGYRVEEEPLYYALIKGYELLEGKGDWVVPTYWCLDTTNGNMFISDRIAVADKFLIEMSKSEWNKLGINDSNADFLKVTKCVTK